METNRKVLITGGTSGIGLATSNLFSDNNYDVLITGSKANKPDGIRLNSGAQFEYQGLDNSLSAEWNSDDQNGSSGFAARLYEIENSSFLKDGLDALVINAGIAEYKPIEDETSQQFNRMMAINVKSHYFIIQRLKKHLLKRNGSITVVSSIITECAFPNSSLYAMTKGALNAMALNLAIEFAPDINVNVVSPGATDTPLVDKLGVPKEAREGFIQSVAQDIPLKRFGSPEDVANVIYSQIHANYVTGSVWRVDGGTSVS